MKASYKKFNIAEKKAHYAVNDNLKFNSDQRSSTQRKYG